MKKRKLLTAALFMGALIFAPHGAAQADDAYMPHGIPITIHIDGEYLPCDVAPMVKNNRTLMPMRAAGEALGATVDWNPTQKTITLSKDSDVVKFVLNSSTYYVNGTAHHADIAPQIVQNRTLIPLRAFAEALNTRVDWNQYLYDVSISTTGEAAQYPQIPSNIHGNAARWVTKYYVEPNNTDPFVGSWTRTSTYQYSPYESSTTTEYDFITKLNGNYQYISVDVSLEPYYGQPVVTVIKNDAWSTGSAYRRFDIPNVLYYIGPPRGFTSEGYSDFDIIADSLVCTGYLDTFVGSNRYEHKYDVYKRF